MTTGSLSQPKLSQVRALRDLGVDKSGRRNFFQGAEIEFQFPSAGGDPVIGFTRLEGNKLKSSIFSIHDESGAGSRAFFQFRNRSLALARASGVSELELSGVAIINPKIKAILVRQGFVRQTIPIPETLGGNGTVEVFTKTFPVK